MRVSRHCTLANGATTMTSSDQYDFLQVSLVDLSGVPRTKTLPRARVAAAEKDGLPCFGGMHAIGLRTEMVAFDELEATRNGNQIILLDMDSLHSKPWLSKEFRVDHVFADMHWRNPNTGLYEPHSACPRSTAKRALAALKEAGYSLYSAFEYEFQLLDLPTLQPAIPEGNDVLVDLSFPPKLRQFLYRSIHALHASGVEIEYFNREYAQSQVEVPLMPLFGVAAADRAVNFKTSMKEMAQDADYVATFMSQALAKDGSNGGRFNFSLWDVKGEKNMLFDAAATSTDNLSSVGRHWLGGLMAHSGALLALCSPTVNCYRRRLFCHNTPATLHWGVEDRISAAIQVKNKCYFENRLVSGPANPYAVLAATVFAGLDGILNHIEPPPQGQAVVEMAHSLESALQQLEEDTVLMRHLGKMADWFIHIKRNVEVKAMGHHNMKKWNEDELQRERDEYLLYT